MSGDSGWSECVCWDAPTNSIESVVFVQRMVSGLPDWMRLWCVMRQNRLRCWKNPENVGRSMPEQVIELSEVRISSSVHTHIPSILCTYKFTSLVALPSTCRIWWYSQPHDCSCVGQTPFSSRTVTLNSTWHSSRRRSESSGWRSCSRLWWTCGCGGLPAISLSLSRTASSMPTHPQHISERSQK